MIDIDVDQLSLYIGEDYVINDNIKVLQPTIRDIARFGEKEFFSVVYTLTAIPSDMKSQLWDMGLDWVEVDDYELFMMLAPTLSKDRTSLILGDLDLSRLRTFRMKDNDNIVLADPENGIIVDKLIYLRIVSYLRKAFNIKSKIERPMNKMTRQILIDEDRQKIALNKDKPFKSYLLPMISALKVKQGYTKDYVLNMGYVEFMDDINRLRIIDNAEHLLNGIYAGTIDTTKINKNELNWMKEI